MNTRRPDWPAISPGRFARTIRTDSADGCRVALLGLPDDLGVRLNNGRPGAADGPTAFRAALASYGTAFDGAAAKPLNIPVFDAGDVIPTEGDDAAALGETHDRVTAAVADLHAKGLTTFCIGGGHDLTFPSVRAISQHVNTPIGGVNVDPHLDVRTNPCSGMPFRAAIDGEFLDPKHFIELGAGRFSNEHAHFEWLRDQGATIILTDDLLAFASAPGEGPMEYAFRAAMPNDNSVGFVSIDLDVIDGSQAPGVSAVNPCGLPVSLVCEIARRAGADPRVKHVDVMELSPPNDDASGRTARIAALLFLHFIAGFAERESASG